VENELKRKTSNGLEKILYWLPRILTIVFIAFLGLFALDSFGGTEPILYQIAGFFIHLIPNFILIAILILAWKKPQIGGVVFLGLGAIFTIFFNTYEHLLNFLFISGPAFLIGILFLFSKAPNKKRKIQN